MAAFLFPQILDDLFQLLVLFDLLFKLFVEPFVVLKRLVVQALLLIGDFFILFLNFLRKLDVLFFDFHKFLVHLHLVFIALLVDISELLVNQLVLFVVLVVLLALLLTQLARERLFHLFEGVLELDRPLYSSFFAHLFIIILLERLLNFLFFLANGSYLLLQLSLLLQDLN